MTNDAPETEPEDLTGIRKALALAAAYGIGPFRRRVRLDDPLPYEPDEASPSITIDLDPPKPEWKYDGQLPHKPVALTKTTYPYAFDRHEKITTPANIGILAYLEHTKLELLTTGAENRRSYDNGFTFNRNGMCYQIEFFEPRSLHSPSHVFTISAYDSTNIYDQIMYQRPMTKQEAEYALGIVKEELPAEDKDRLAAHIKRLEAHLPTETEAQASLGESFYKWDYFKQGPADSISFEKLYPGKFVKGYNP